jgi:PhnB protein
LIHHTREAIAMASVSTYLNFARSTEEAFTFYRGVFGTEFVGEVMRFGDAPPIPGQPPLADADRNLVMHVALPTIAGHMIMGTDAPESMGFSLNQGNNVYINLEPDTRGETDRLFTALGDGGTVEMALAEQFWGDYFGSLTDRFGTRWMFNCRSKT